MSEHRWEHDPDGNHRVFRLIHDNVIVGTFIGNKAGMERIVRRLNATERLSAEDAIHAATNMHVDLYDTDLVGDNLMAYARELEGK